MPAPRRAPLLVALLVTAVAALTAAFASPSANATSVLLANTLLITSGNDSGGLTGSYFVMRDARGTPIVNSSTGTTYTLLRAGTGGLRLLAYTEAPSPAFDGSGNALASTIIQPTLFAGVRFSVATPRVDPVSRATNNLPQIIVNLLLIPPTIRVDLGAWTAYWNSQTFNQGAAFDATSYDLRTGRIVLDWSKRITSGPFANFIGNWHVEGTVTRL